MKSDEKEGERESSGEDNFLKRSGRASKKKA